MADNLALPTLGVFSPNTEKTWKNGFRFYLKAELVEYHLSAGSASQVERTVETVQQTVVFGVLF
jgi:hypothetical protein